MEALGQENDEANLTNTPPAKNVFDQYGESCQSVTTGDFLHSVIIFFTTANKLMAVGVGRYGMSSIGHVKSVA